MRYSRDFKKILVSPERISNNILYEVLFDEPEDFDYMVLSTDDPESIEYVFFEERPKVGGDSTDITGMFDDFESDSDDDQDHEWPNAVLTTLTDAHAEVDPSNFTSGLRRNLQLQPFYKISWLMLSHKRFRP